MPDVEVQSFVSLLRDVGGQIARVETAVNDVKVSIATLATAESVAAVDKRLTLVEQQIAQGETGFGRWFTLAGGVLIALLGLLVPHLRWH